MFYSVHNSCVFRVYSLVKNAIQKVFERNISCHISVVRLYIYCHPKSSHAQSEFQELRLPYYISLTINFVPIVTKSVTNIYKERERGRRRKRGVTAFWYSVSLTLEWFARARSISWQRVFHASIQNKNSIIHVSSVLPLKQTFGVLILILS